MTFTQIGFDFYFSKYRIEDSGLYLIRKKLFSTTESFIKFENIGSEIIKQKDRKYLWLFCSILFLAIALYVFNRRLHDYKVGETAEIFHLCISFFFCLVYQFRSENKLILFKDENIKGIEFNGTIWYKKSLDQFVKHLLQSRDNYLKSKYPVIEGLTLDEIVNCMDAKLDPQDGLFLKRLTKHFVERLIFKGVRLDAENSSAICSLTTEKNARKIISKHQDELINAGKYIYISGFSENKYKVTLIGTTSDPCKIMEHSGTNGGNYGIETEDIVEKYKKWNKEFGVKTIGIGFDFCEFEIMNKEIDYKKLATEVYEFCPDVVDQGTETIENLENEIKKTGKIFLWWD